MCKRKSQCRFLCLLAVTFLIASNTRSAESIAPVRVYPLAAAVVPEAIAPPVIDGKLDDLAWRSPAAAPRLLTTTPDGLPAPVTASIRLACDARFLYLFFAQTDRRPAAPVPRQAKKTSRAFLSIEFGATPWLSQQIRITPDGRSQESQWTGWEMSSRWRSRSQVATVNSATAWQVEIAIPRVELSPTSVQAGARAVLRVTLHGRAGEPLAQLSLAKGYGIILGKDYAPRFITRIDRREGKSEWQLSLMHWNAEQNSLMGKISTLQQAGKASRKGWYIVKQNGALRTTTIPLPASLPASKSSRAVLRLRRSKAEIKTPSDEVYPLFLAGGFMPTKNFHHLREALRRTAALPNSKRNPDPHVMHAQKILADWDRQAYSVALAKLVLAIKSSAATNSTSPSSPIVTDDGLSPLSREMLTGAYDAAGRPRWQILARLAKDKAYARIAYQNALRFSNLNQRRQNTAEVTQRFRAWQSHRQTLPPPIVHRVHPAWKMDIAATRLLVLIDLARGAFTTSAGQEVLPACLEEILVTAAWLQDNLNRSGTSYPYNAVVGRALVAAVKYLPILFRSEEKSGFIAYYLSTQLVAHTLPDGAGVFPDASQLEFTRLLAHRGALAPPYFLPRTKIAPHPLGQKILTYLAARILPTGRLPQLAGSPSHITEADLAGWGRAYYPTQPAFGRFTPEGLIAIPQHKSVPRDATQVFGGIYTMRGRADSLVCIVTGGGRRGFGGRSAAARYGRVLLADSRHEYLTEGVATLGQMQLAGHGVATETLPPTGEVLPHRWQHTPDADFLTLPWQPTGGNPSGAQATRSILFIKGLAERSVVYICDTIKRTTFGSPAAMFTQSFTRPARKKSPARLIPLAGRTISYRLMSQGHERVMISGTLSGHDSAELFVVPPQLRLALPVPTFVRLGRRLKAGGGVYRLSGSSTRRDYILSDPGRSGFSGKFGTVEAQLVGELALVRLDEKGLASISGFGVSQVDLNRGPIWGIRCTPTASISLRRKRGGSFVVERLDVNRMPVLFEFSLTPQGGTEARKARLQLEVGKRIVFRLL